MPDLDEDPLVPPIHLDPNDIYVQDWYTDQRPQRSVVNGATSTFDRYLGGEYVEFANHMNDRVQRQVYEAATDRWVHPYPSDLAGEFGLVSANAAVLAILAHGDRLIMRHTYLDDGDGDRTQHQQIIDTAQGHLDHYRQFSACPCEACYVPAEVPGCVCNEPHCNECYPDGPPDWCECEECQYEQNDSADDDQGWHDDFSGLPEVTAPEGRCRFGVEIEFDRQPGYDDYMRSQIIQAMNRNGIACVDLGYTHEVTRCWKMTTDATVSGGEVVSPIMSGSDESIEEVREVLRLVKNHGGTASRNVGMHVHLDISRFRTSQLKALVTNMMRAEKMLAAYVPEHRYNGEISCGAMLYSEDEWYEILDWVDGIDPAEHRRSRENRESSCPVDRYQSINWNSVLTYGTVEVRLLGHTLNTIKVRTWIRALQTIIDASSRRALISGDGLEWLVEHGLEPEHAERFRDVAISRGKTAWLQIAA